MEEYKAGSSVYVAVLTDSDEPISVSIDKVAELESFTLVNDVTPVFIEDFYTGWVPDTVMEFELLFEDGKKERFHFGENSSYYGELHVEHSWQGWEETSENPHLDCYFANYPDIKMEVPVSLVNLEEANVPVIDTIGTEHVINRNFNNSNMFCFIPKVDGSYRFRIKENGIDVTESAGAEYLLVSADDERTSYFNHENVTVKLKAGDKLYVAEYAFEKDITVSVENGNPIEKIVMKGSVPKSYIWEIVSYGDDSKYWEKCSFEITFKDGSTQTVQLLDEKVNGYGIVYCAWPWKEGTDEEVAIGDNLTLQFKVKGCEDVTCDITRFQFKELKICYRRRSIKHKLMTYCHLKTKIKIVFRDSM